MSLIAGKDHFCTQNIVKIEDGNIFGKKWQKVVGSLSQRLQIFDFKSPFQTAPLNAIFMGSSSFQLEMADLPMEIGSAF